MKLTQAQLQHIKTLEDRHGRLSARRVLADARKPKSPLHSLSVWRGWNDKKLVEVQLLHCARLVIGAVTVQVTHNERVIKSCAYVVDTSAQGRSGGGGYRSVQAMIEDPASARESLIYTLEVAAGHLRRAYDLAAPLGLSKEIDALLAQIAGVKKIAESNKKAA
jgi:hypothetical protein